MVTAFCFDFSGALLLLGVVLALCRETFARLKRRISLPEQDPWSLLLIGGIVTAGFLLELAGFRWGFITLAFLPGIALFFVPFVPHTVGTSHPVKRRALVAKTGLSGLYLGGILRQMGVTGSASLIYVYMATLGIPAGTMGIVNAVNPIIQILGMLLFGRLADRIGRKPIFSLGFGLSALVPVVYALSQSGWEIALGYMTLGIAFSSLYTGSAAYIGDRIPAENQGAMLGLFGSSRGLGGVLGPLIAGAITPITGFKGMFLAMAGIGTLGFLLVLSRTRGTLSSSA